MSKFLGREYDGHAGAKCITLEKSEYDKYNGNGPAIVHVHANAKIEEIKYLGEIFPEDLRDAINTAFKHPDAYFAYCSCYELIDAQSLKNPAIAARVLRVHAETWADYPFEEE